jgi:hypothetical protein
MSERGGVGERKGMVHKERKGMREKEERIDRVWEREKGEVRNERVREKGEREKEKVFVSKA